jgi:hypothetical protein
LRAPIGEKSDDDDSKDNFYDELEQDFYQFSKYHKKFLIGDFNAKVGRMYFFKPTIGNDSLHQNGHDNGIGTVNFATLEEIIVKSTMFPHRNIHNYNWIFPDGKTHNQIDHVLIHMRWNSIILDVRSFRGVDCDTDHSLVVVNVRDRLAVSKEEAQKFDGERFNLSKLNELEVRKQFQIEIANKVCSAGKVKR